MVYLIESELKLTKYPAKVCKIAFAPLLGATLK